MEDDVQSGFAMDAKTKKEVIRDCALDVFAEKGFVNTPVRDIIDRSGFGTSTFYRYYKNKEDVLKSLLEYLFQEILEGITEYYSHEKDLLKRFIETKRIALQVFVSNRKLSELYSRTPGISPEIDACIQGFDDKFLAFSRKNIKFGISRGVFTDVSPDAIALSILSIIKYAVFRWAVLGDITEQEMIGMVISFHESLATGILKQRG